VIKANRPLKLVDLSGEGLTVLDADARLCTGCTGGYTNKVFRY